MSMNERDLTTRLQAAYVRRKSDHAFSAALCGLVAVIILIVTCGRYTDLLDPVDYFVAMGPATIFSLCWCFSSARMISNDRQAVEPHWWWVMRSFLIPFLTGFVILAFLMFLGFLQKH